MAVFEPNLTSKLIVKATCDLVPESGWRWAEIGCGNGWISEMVAAQSNLHLKNLVASDISHDAINAARQRFGNRIDANQLFVGPGATHLVEMDIDFDLVICDIAAISDLFGSRYEWYNGVPANCGVDGLSNLREALPEVHACMKPEATVVLPTISLADSEGLMSLLKEHFSEVDLVLSQKWPLPDQPEWTTDFEKSVASANLSIPEFKYGKRIAETGVLVCRK